MYGSFCNSACLKKSFNQKFNNLYSSILFATLIVTAISYFLLGFRSALIVGSVIPLTIFLVLYGCRLLDLPLHQTSMTGIIIALGLLIAVKNALDVKRSEFVAALNKTGNSE